MVLESLINPAKAEKEPWEMFFIGILYSSIAIFLSLYIFGGSETSLVLVFLTVMACSILMYNTLRFEEKQDIKLRQERKLLEHHGKALSFFVFLFLGFVVSFALWYVFLPSDIPQQVFESQIATINQINGPSYTGMIVAPEAFLRIFLNNVKVVFFALFFSFFYGLGAIFILTWNASIVGVATGIYIRNLINSALVKTGFVSLTHYFSFISVGLFRYLIHGIPEISAYFISGLAGGIISVAVLYKKPSSEEMVQVLKDAGWLLLIAMVLLLIAALLEVFVTPLVL